MYRGPPPNGKLLGVAIDVQQNLYLGRFAKIQIENLQEIARNFIGPKIKKIDIDIFIQNEISKRRFLLSTIKGKSSRQEIFFKKEKMIVEVQESVEHKLIIDISTFKRRRLTGIFGILKKKNDSISTFLSFPKSDEYPQVRQSFPNINVDVRFLKMWKQVDDLILRINPGTFSKIQLPEKLEEVFGPIPLENSPSGGVNDCISATHRINLPSSGTELKVEILHSISLCLSAVKVNLSKSFR